MIHLFAVAQLMHDDTIEDFLRRQHKETIKTEVSSGTATAPSRFLCANGDRAVRYPHDGCIIGDALRDHFLRLTGKGTQLFLGQRGRFKGRLRPLLRLCHMLDDPAFMFEKELLDLTLGSRYGRADDESALFDLCAE